MTSLTIYMGEGPTTDDPQWAVDLRAAFTGITYANTYTVPDSITHDGSEDVRDDLQDFIDSIDDGPSATSHNRIVFPSGYTYKIDGGSRTYNQGFELNGRHNLTLDGTGCHLDCTTMQSSGSLWGAIWYIHYSSYIVLRGFSADGVNANAGTVNATYDEAYASVGMAGNSSYIECDSLHLDYQSGFGFWSCSNQGTEWANHIWVHDCYIRGSEMSIAIVSTRYYLAEDNQIDDSTLTAIDLESDVAQVDGGGFEDVLIQDNTFDYYGWNTDYTNWWLATVPSNPSESTANRLTVRRNHVYHGNARYSGDGGLATRANETTTGNCVAKTDYLIHANTTDHASTNPQYGQVMTFQEVDGLTVTNNTQLVTSGGFETHVDCTDVTISGNITT